MSGTFNSSTGFLNLLFDQPLKPAALSTLNFSQRYARNLWNYWTINASGSSVTGIANAGPVVPPGKWITYFGTPLEILSVHDVPAVPFTQFPLT